MDNHVLLKLKEDLKAEILNELYGKKRSETEWNRLCDELLDPGLNDLFGGTSARFKSRSAICTLLNAVFNTTAVYALTGSKAKQAGLFINDILELIKKYKKVGV